MLLFFSRYYSLNNDGEESTLSRKSKYVSKSHLGGIEDLLYGGGDLGPDTVSRYESAFVYLAAIKPRASELRGDLLTSATTV